ncbi:MAG: deoxyhypusine synthase family protein [Candidatus Burarchaeum sp.]|nr:deoxyhypusine synthase family protein [Candidatus Burarchaeum sp.]MDO8339113.1 deoxyhypusine synthase family protein [Candidatus Burarchaeum sp.]
MTGEVRKFITRNYKHFNAAALVDAAEAYAKLIDEGGKMFLAMAGAMSTAELGISLAEMIRKDKVHAISCTGANLEEDLFNLIANKHYVRVPNYRQLSPKEEKELCDSHLNRVTDTCIPEEEAMRRIERAVFDVWKRCDEQGKSALPHEALYEVLRSGALEQYYEIDPKDSWLMAAAGKNLPIFVPGWEDSTLGNAFVADYFEGKIKNMDSIKGGLFYMKELVDWYTAESAKQKIGFFQIGGGIAGDFPICVVPLIRQDLKKQVPFWSYFCQISDSTTSYGGYSGAVPNEKITWGKLDADTPRFIIESDATIVVPLMFAYVLGL